MEAERLRAILASAKAGSPEGYRMLLEAYGPRLFGYFLRATASHHDAEDLLGELMLRLVQRLKSYDHRGRFDQWVFRIAANMVRDRIRRQKASPRSAGWAAQEGEQQDLLELIAARHEAVDKPLADLEAGEKLNRALGELDEVTRHMILLRHFAEMSFKEIAELFDCPLGTALARVHRGLRALRKMLGDVYESE